MEASEQQQPPRQSFRLLANQLERAVLTYTRENSRWALQRSRELVRDMWAELVDIDQLLERAEQGFLLLRSTETQHTDELTEIDQALALRSLGDQGASEEGEADHE